MLDFKSLQKIDFSHMKKKDWKTLLPFAILLGSLAFKLYRKLNENLTKQVININEDGTIIEN